MRWLKSILVALTLGLVAQPMAASPIAISPVSFDSNGLTATFSGSPDPHGFMFWDIDPGLSNYVDGGVILTSAPSQSLVIQFSHPVAVWGFYIMLPQFSPDDVSLTGYLGATFVSQNFVTPSFSSPVGFMEGGYGFHGGGLIDTLVIKTVHGGSFVIDDVEALWFDGGQEVFSVFDFPIPVPAPVPEPMTLALFGAGLAGVGAMRRKKKAARPCAG